MVISTHAESEALVLVFGKTSAHYHDPPSKRWHGPARSQFLSVHGIDAKAANQHRFINAERWITTAMH